MDFHSFFYVILHDVFTVFYSLLIKYCIDRLVKSAVQYWANDIISMMESCALLWKNKQANTFTLQVRYPTNLVHKNTSNSDSRISPNSCDLLHFLVMASYYYKVQWLRTIFGLTKNLTIVLGIMILVNLFANSSHFHFKLYQRNILEYCPSKLRVV